MMKSWSYLILCAFFSYEICLGVGVGEIQLQEGEPREIVVGALVTQEQDLDLSVGEGEIQLQEGEPREIVGALEMQQ